MTAAIFDLVRWSQAELVPDHVMSDGILWVCCKERVLLLLHLLANRLVDQVQRYGSLGISIFYVRQHGGATSVEGSAGTSSLLGLRHDSHLKFFVDTLYLI